MGIFKRIKTITMAEMNGLLDGIEDPIAMLMNIHEKWNRKL
ncbi:PspA/IM30 family protein [Neobacillus drentensis]